MRSFFSVLVFAFVSTVSAQKAPQWGNLVQGPFAIGYKTILLNDDTRHYLDNGRPIQVYVWYPASIKTGEKQMNYGAYFDDIGHDWGNDPNTVTKLKNEIVSDFKIGSLGPSFPAGMADTTFQKILETPIPVYHNALPAQGKFPVLLHAHANGLLHQSLMMEYLASYGYVVMSISMYGTSPAFYGRGEDGNEALLDLTQDLALVLAQAKKLPFADTDKAAVIGILAQAGLSLQMKEMPLKAIACLDCTWNVPEIKKLPYYDTKKIRIPVLEVVNTDFVAQQYSYLDSLVYAERFIGRYHVFPYADFYPFPKIARPAESHGFSNYEYMLVLTVKFLEAVFKTDDNAKTFRTNPGADKSWPAGYLFMRKKEALPPIPLESEFLSWLRYGEMAKVNEAWKNFGPSIFTKPDNLFFVTMFLVRDKEPQALDAIKIYSEAFPGDVRIGGMLNRLGYDAIQVRQFEKAQEIFDLFARLFPYSPYACNGLADVYIARGQKAKAKEQAKKLLDLLEKASMNEREKQALKENAELILDLK